MAFSADERRSLLAVRGVGPTVIARLEQLGIGSFAALREADAGDVVARAAAIVGGTCWRNSPQARAAIEAAIALARSHAV